MKPVKPTAVRIEIPAELEPIERGELYGLPLCDLFDELGDGEVVGGGTLGRKGHLKSCEVTIEISNVASILPRIILLLNDANAPPGTLIRSLARKEPLYIVPDVDG